MTCKIQVLLRWLPSISTIRPVPLPVKTWKKKERGKSRTPDADNGGEGFDSDGDRNETSLLSAMKTRRRYAELGKLLEGCIKRRRLPSPSLSEEGIETEIESDISSFTSFTSSQRGHTSTLQPTSSHFTSLEGDVSEDRAMESVNK